jgi:superfamily II DNA or RNA helicase
MTHIEITVYPTYFSFFHDLYKYLYHLGLMDLSKFVNKHLADYTYDYRLNKYIAGHQYVYYDTETHEIRFPRQLLNIFIEHLKNANINYTLITNIKFHKPIKHHLKFNPEFVLRPDQQVVVQHLSNPDLHMVASELQTGMGKSICATQAAINLKYNMLICSNNLTEQWFDKLLLYTNVQIEHIEIISGINSIVKIWDRIKNNNIPKILLCSVPTLMNYIKYKDAYLEFPPLQKMIEQCGIHTKILDEVHLGFKANVTLDLTTIIPHSIYLTATFLRTNKTENKVFQKIYPTSLHHLQKEVIKYTNVVFYSYSLGASIKYPNFRTNRGYSHFKYEKFLLDQINYLAVFLNKILIPLINIHFIKNREPHHKAIIFGDTIKFCQTICSQLRIVYPDLIINTKLNMDPEENLESDIIVTTFKSCGTGSDIPNLKVIFNTVSFCSEVYTIQVFGRLRKLLNAQTYMIDMYNGRISDMIRHKYLRQKTYLRIAKEIVETSINM